MLFKQLFIEENKQVERKIGMVYVFLILLVSAATFVGQRIMEYMWECIHASIWSSDHTGRIEIIGIFVGLQVCTCEIRYEEVMSIYPFIYLSGISGSGANESLQ